MIWNLELRILCSIKLDQLDLRSSPMSIGLLNLELRILCSIKVDQLDLRGSTMSLCLLNLLPKFISLLLLNITYSNKEDK